MKNNYLSIFIIFCLGFFLIGCETFKGAGSGIKKDVKNTAENTVQVTKVVVGAPVVASKAVTEGTKTAAKTAGEKTMALDSWIKENMW